MSKTNSRAVNTRETESKEYTYQEPNYLDVPTAVTNRFVTEDMVLRWVRISLKGEDDYKNVGNKMTQGWVFVTPEEVPEMLHSATVLDTGRYTNCVVRGDVALAKMPRGKAVARNDYYEAKANDLMEAVNQQLMSASNSKMPISNNSTSTVTKGRMAQFQA
jgi:hypothetical protein|tara:strand:+ start:1162 stop:1644 length:483 start_codon:yes stop_codon:yes gene_type:complete